jgi:hypothetical protein
MGVPSLSGMGVYPPPPPVSPLIYDKMTEKGGTIPSVNQKKFLGKMDPPLGNNLYICKKNFWEKLWKSIMVGLYWNIWKKREMGKELLKFSVIVVK